MRRTKEAAEDIIQSMGIHGSRNGKMK